MTPDEYCQDKTNKSGSSFYYSFLYLQPEPRRAITAIYAFCREVDDVVDECSDPSLARVKLGWWRNEIDNLYRQKPEHPVTKALAPHIVPFNLEKENFLAIIDGMEMDLDQSRYLDWVGLKKYCWHAASAVGLLSARVFGFSNPATLQYAEKLGLALQMTNIIRDIGDDARRGRIYLPIEDLQAFNVKAADILNSNYNDNFKKLMAFEAQRARQLYKEAFTLLPEEDRRAQRPGIMMAAIYHALLKEIEHEEWNILDQRISLTPIRKFFIAWKIWINGGKTFTRDMRNATP